MDTKWFIVESACLYPILISCSEIRGNTCFVFYWETFEAILQRLDEGTVRSGSLGKCPDFLHLLRSGNFKER